MHAYFNLSKGTFFDGSFIQKFGKHWYIQWRLKKRFTKERIQIKKGETSKDIANWWFQNWSIHGLREEKNFNTTQFVGIHNNVFIGGTSREACEERIVLYIYCDDDVNHQIKVMEINDIPLKTHAEYQENKKKKLPQKNIINRKRTRDEMEKYDNNYIHGLHFKVNKYKDLFNKEKKRNDDIIQQYQDKCMETNKLAIDIEQLSSKNNTYIMQFYWLLQEKANWEKISNDKDVNILSLQQKTEILRQKVKELQKDNAKNIDFI